MRTRDSTTKSSKVEDVVWAPSRGDYSAQSYVPVIFRSNCRWRQTVRSRHSRRRHQGPELCCVEPRLDERRFLTCALIHLSVLSDAGKGCVAFLSVVGAQACSLDGASLFKYWTVVLGVARTPGDTKFPNHQHVPLHSANYRHYVVVHVISRAVGGW